jgi:hypothetical protein
MFKKVECNDKSGVGIIGGNCVLTNGATFENPLGPAAVKADEAAKEAAHSVAAAQEKVSELHAKAIAKKKKK